MTALPFLAAGVLVLSMPLAAAAAAPQTAPLTDSSGKAIGQVTLTPAPAGVLLRVEAKGLTPGWHGLHLHAVADCGGAGFKQAGAHINHPGHAMPHGLLNPQGPDAGDLPNLFVHADGTAQGETFTSLVRLGAPGTDAAESPTLPNLLDGDGSALIIHASPDDHVSQPIGGAGDRVACALIKAN